jgi:PAS domain S-box-containing protein
LPDSGDIVVVGGSDAERAGLVGQLDAAGLAARSAGAIRIDVGPPPALIVVTGADAAHLVAEAREAPQLADVPILAVIAAVPPTAATEALGAGAADVARLPMSPGVLAKRCRNLIAQGQTKARAAHASALSRVNEILTREGDDGGALVAALEVAAEALGFDRASLIAHIEGSEHAYVIAATDDPSRSQFTLSVAEYPEVAEAIKTLAPVLIDDALDHELTRPVADKLAKRGVRALAVFPVQWRGRPLGTILLRRAVPGASHIGARGAELGRLIATLLAAHLRHGPVLQSLRDQTHRISRVRYEAERRLRGIDSLKEHFEAGADGVVVLDDAGRMLFVNRAAERITGFARDGLLGSELADLVARDQRAAIPDAVAKVLAGANLEPFDLQLSTTTGSPAWVSVATSTVLADSGAVILTFRDVTSERALESELRSTKEFLERLIDSTVDAIIASDLRGNIILFNQGAERLFGYRATEIIGKKPVWELYEHGVARQIMRMLRSTSYGGVGRLEQTRREIRTRVGEIVPVSITASIIYEGEREVATVGIITDLRERIRMEQRLLQAQQKLQITEKQAVVAELAGAAAHELNQPLTSIMGYAQLVQRQSPADAAHMRAIGVILSESERMAGIVKKIGRLTKYETIDYVGGARMIDLDRSAASDPQLVIPDQPEPDDRPEDDTGPGPIRGANGAGAGVSSTDPTPVVDAPDDERMTREFGAVTPPPEVLAAAGDLGELFEDSTHSGPPPTPKAEPEAPREEPTQERKP